MIITEKLLEYTLKHQEPYEVEIPLTKSSLFIMVFPNVFPPISPFSYDSVPLAQSVEQYFNEHYDKIFTKSVLDVGSGTGIHSIVSAIKGAKKVVATDISPYAIDNINYNVQIKNLQNVIETRKGNLFEPIKKDEKFDLVIANLPFVNHPAKEHYEHWVYDEDYQSHKTFFRKVSSYLTENGNILIAFSDIGDMDFFENEIKKNSLEIINHKKYEKITHNWTIHTLGRKT